MFGLLEDVDLQDGSIPSVQRPLYKFIKEDHFKLYIFFFRFCLLYSCLNKYINIITHIFIHQNTFVM